MSALADRVSADLKAAMKEHRELELSVFRMLKAELQKFQADKGVSYELSDDDVISLVGRLVKQRREAAEQYKAAGADDRAESELAEIEVLDATFLPSSAPRKWRRSSAKRPSKSAPPRPRTWAE